MTENDEDHVEVDDSIKDLVPVVEKHKDEILEFVGLMTQLKEQKDRKLDEEDQGVIIDLLMKLLPKIIRGIQKEEGFIITKLKNCELLFESTRLILENEEVNIYSEISNEASEWNNRINKLCQDDIGIEDFIDKCIIEMIFSINVILNRIGSTGDIKILKATNNLKSFLEMVINEVFIKKDKKEDV